MSLGRSGPITPGAASFTSKSCSSPNTDRPLLVRRHLRDAVGQRCNRGVFRLAGPSGRLVPGILAKPGEQGEDRQAGPIGSVPTSERRNALRPVSRKSKTLAISPSWKGQRRRRSVKSRACVRPLELVRARPIAEGRKIPLCALPSAPAVRALSDRASYKAFATHDDEEPVAARFSRAWSPRQAGLSSGRLVVRT